MSSAPTSPAKKSWLCISSRAFLDQATHKLSALLNRPNSSMRQPHSFNCLNLIISPCFTIIFPQAGQSQPSSPSYTWQCRQAQQ